MEKLEPTLARTSLQYEKINQINVFRFLKNVKQVYVSHLLLWLSGLKNLAAFSSFSFARRVLSTVPVELKTFVVTTSVVYSGAC